MKPFLLALVVLGLACGHLTGPDVGSGSGTQSESETCTEELAARDATNSAGCRCINGGVEGSWGPHWARPWTTPDGGVDVLHGNERWCPRR